MTLQELIHRYLSVLLQRGHSRIAVDEGARAILRSWILAARQGRRLQPGPLRPAPAQEPHADHTQAGPSARDSRQPEAAPGTTQETLATQAAQETQAVQAARSGPLSAAIASDPPPGAGDTTTPEDIPYFRVPGSTPAELWQHMERLLPVWTPLQTLGTLRSTAVMGTGKRDADILFLGDAPGYYDELAKQPFQGEAGKKLDGMLTAMGLTREQVYITHLVKFRPALPRQTTNNRTPSPKEILFSRSIVELEIRLVQPKVIVALGVVAARGLLQRGDLPLAEYQAQRHDYNGIPVVVTHHPSYLLRTSDLTERRRLWEEMLGVMQLAGLPISDKQRGYFLPKNARS